MKTKNIIIIGLVAAAAIAVIGIRAHADTTEGEDLKPLSASYAIVETTDLNKLNGRRFDELFGEIPFDKKVGRFKNPGDRYEGTLLEYVTEIEYGRY